MCNKKQIDVYVASCVESGGIYHYKMIDGIMSLVDISHMDRPMYMIVKERKMYILLREPFANGESGLVIYDINDEGELINPSDIISTQGEVACHLLVDYNDIYCVNYISGSIIKMPELLVEHTGHGVHPQRQEKPHTHFVGLTPDNDYVCVTDLGVDTIFIYRKDMTLHSSTKVPEGQGVRHLAFSEDGKYLFAVNELGSTVAAYAYDNGMLTFVDICSCLPGDFKGVSAASAIRVHNGLIYASNRGHDSIAVMQFKENKLQLLNCVSSRGNTPRDFWFAEKYLLVANQDSNHVSVLDIDSEFAVAHELEIETPICVCSI